MKLMRTKVMRLQGEKHRDTYKYCLLLYLNIKSSGVGPNKHSNQSCARLS